MSKYTEGPWEVVGPYFDVYQADSSEYICQSSKSQGDRREANARLIAEAPAMVEAMLAVLTAWDEPYYGDLAQARDTMFDPIEAARVVLARIEGATK